MMAKTPVSLDVLSDLAQKLAKTNDRALKHKDAKKQPWEGNEQRRQYYAKVLAAQHANGTRSAEGWYKSNQTAEGRKRIGDETAKRWSQEEYRVRVRVSMKKAANTTEFKENVSAAVKLWRSDPAKNAATVQAISNGKAISRERFLAAHDDTFSDAVRAHAVMQTRVGRKGMINVRATSVAAGIDKLAFDRWLRARRPDLLPTVSSDDVKRAKEAEWDNTFPPLLEKLMYLTGRQLDLKGTAAQIGADSRHLEAWLTLRHPKLLKNTGRAGNKR